MCNAKPEQKFRSYGGLVLNVGAVEMLADSAVDVSKDTLVTYFIRLFCTNTESGKDGSSDTASVTSIYGQKTQEETVCPERTHPHFFQQSY